MDNTIILPDHGPIYTETVLGRFPVEPWNTFSNLIFLFTFLYFFRQVRNNLSAYPLLRVCLPILFIGFVGGTIFHATRSSRIWLMMDYIPILLICLFAAFYFWKDFSGSYLLAFIGIAFPFALIRFLWTVSSLAVMHKVAIGYSTLALSLIIPAFLCARKEKWAGAKFLFLSIASFLIAIVCRSIDQTFGTILPMGTHFLWHLFGGLSAFCMLKFAEGFERRVKLRL